MALTPDNAPTSLIHALHDIAATQLPSAMVPELFFSTTKRHGLDGVPVSRDTAPERICPTCRTFEIDVELCPRCTRVQDNRKKFNAAEARHNALIRQENTERRLTEIAPDWREKFADWQDAEIFYLKPRATHTVYHSNAEPDEIHDDERGSAEDWDE